MKTVYDYCTLQTLAKDIRVCYIFPKALKGKELDFVYIELDKHIVNVHVNYHRYMGTQV